MNEEIALLTKFGDTNIPIEAIAETYLNLSPKVASRRAAAGGLGFPAYRLGTSNRAHWFVHVTDLAKWMQQKRQDALEEFDQIYGAKKPSLAAGKPKLTRKPFGT